MLTKAVLLSQASDLLFQMAIGLNAQLQIFYLVFAIIHIHNILTALHTWSILVTVHQL